MKRTFLIAPVRGFDPQVHATVVSDLESAGYTVHWPARDTDQNDDTGLGICHDNYAAIYEANCVHVIWDGKSQGCLFDLGMAFAMHKPVIPITLPNATEGKSFQNMIRKWAENRLLTESHICVKTVSLKRRKQMTQDVDRFFDGILLANKNAVTLVLIEERLSDGSKVYNLQLSGTMPAVSLEDALEMQRKVKEALDDHGCDNVGSYERGFTS